MRIAQDGGGGGVGEEEEIVEGEKREGEEGKTKSEMSELGSTSPQIGNAPSRSGGLTSLTQRLLTSVTHLANSLLYIKRRAPGNAFCIKGVLVFSTAITFVVSPSLVIETVIVSSAGLMTTQKEYT